MNKLIASQSFANILLAAGVGTSILGIYSLNTQNLKTEQVKYSMQFSDEWTKLGESRKHLSNWIAHVNRETSVDEEKMKELATLYELNGARKARAELLHFMRRFLTLDKLGLLNDDISRNMPANHHIRKWLYEGKIADEFECKYFQKEEKWLDSIPLEYSEVIDILKKRKSKDIPVLENLERFPPKSK